MIEKNPNADTPNPPEPPLDPLDPLDPASSQGAKEPSPREDTLAHQPDPELISPPPAPEPKSLATPDPIMAPEPESVADEPAVESATPSASDPEPPVLPAISRPDMPPPRRLMSIDALRGFDMFWIIGGAYLVHAFQSMSETPLLKFLTHHLTHADWETPGLLVGMTQQSGPALLYSGLRFYDLIFPLFVFIVGVSLVFSLGRIMDEEGRGTAISRIFRRSILLFALGIIFSGGFSTLWPEIRLMGVLNRIALCYFFTGLFFVFFRTRGLVVICVGLLLLYWGLMTYVTVPEIGAGSFDKGANLANYLDEQYLPGKKWDGTWDPEGLLSTIPAVATCLLGVFAGFLLRKEEYSHGRKVFYLLFAGSVAILLGWIWGQEFPVIKKIWTSSYVLVTAGWSAILLALFYLVVDVWKWRWWCQPFVWIGLNPITVYMANNIIGFEALAQRFANGNISAALDARVAEGVGELFVAVVAVSFGIFLCRFLHRKRIYLRA